MLGLNKTDDRRHGEEPNDHCHIRVDGNGSVRSVERAFAILQIIAEHPGSVTLGHISDTLGLPKSSTHRLLETLARCGYATREQHGTYSLGSAAEEMAAIAFDRVSVSRKARGLLAQAAVDLGTAAAISTRFGRYTKMLYSARAPTDSVPFRSRRIGQLTYVERTADGKALLSLLTDQAVESLLGIGVGKHSKLISEIRMVRDRGYAIETPSQDRPAFCIAMAITTSVHRRQFALTVRLTGSVTEDGVAKTASRTVQRYLLQLGDLL